MGHGLCVSAFLHTKSSGNTSDAAGRIPTFATSSSLFEVCGGRRCIFVWKSGFPLHGKEFMAMAVSASIVWLKEVRETNKLDSAGPREICSLPFFLEPSLPPMRIHHFKLPAEDVRRCKAFAAQLTSSNFHRPLEFRLAWRYFKGNEIDRQPHRVNISNLKLAFPTLVSRECPTFTNHLMIKH